MGENCYKHVIIENDRRLDVVSRVECDRHERSYTQYMMSSQNYLYKELKVFISMEIMHGTIY